MVFPDFPGEDDRQVGCRLLCFSKGEKMRHLCESVFNHPQLVASFSEWQFRNEVHCDGLPGGIR